MPTLTPPWHHSWPFLGMYGSPRLVASGNRSKPRPEAEVAFASPRRRFERRLAGLLREAGPGADPQRDARQRRGERGGRKGGERAGVGGAEDLRQGSFHTRTLCLLFIFVSIMNSIPRRDQCDWNRCLITLGWWCQGGLSGAAVRHGSPRQVVGLALE